ncbi:hypothetical protein F4803DRAFT_185014 [Xylaria telfairii]|nr:hypothetical protein F4803DRAFT_185014 [Xylaria telfairii]
MLVHSWQGWAGQAWARRGRRRGRGRERARGQADLGTGLVGDLFADLFRWGQTRRKSAAGRSIGSVCGLYCALWGRELPSGRGTTLKMPIGVDMRALVDEPNGQRTTSTKRNKGGGTPIAHRQPVSKSDRGSITVARVVYSNNNRQVEAARGDTHTHTHTHAHTHTQPSNRSALRHQAEGSWRSNCASLAVADLI